MFSGNNIAFVLSGGASNTDPARSLGGEPSGYPVTSGINNLFHDISVAQSAQGHIDYRCIYVYNNSAIDPFYSVAVSSTPTTSGATKTIGVPVATDRQQIVITGHVTGGSFTLVYDPSEPDVVTNWNATPSVWADNLKNALNALSSLSDVEVDIVANISQTIFTIRFEGNDDHKQHPLLWLKSNNLTPGIANPVVSKITNGAPINNVASSISNDTITPTGISFGTATITLGTLRPGDGFPVWIKRSAAVGITANYGDGLDLKISGSPIP